MTLTVTPPMTAVSVPSHTPVMTAPYNTVRDTSLNYPFEPTIGGPIILEYGFELPGYTIRTYFNYMLSLKEFDLYTHQTLILVPSKNHFTLCCDASDKYPQLDADDK